ncbi:hypothetical protein DFO70_1662 [Cytobacillus firmus]|uniref:MORN repeat protein n=2 Tax=Cytobacillus TaxID=2675230 RepID=A0A366JAH7_CYTFI|nr:MULTISPECIES: hypothetical protein [Cytobacillus]RBP84036.1 hypothetical protein DFO70_1662 [Cytobacillus firmus]TDX47179.1 hypothetical protein DFO72_101267 [Cytobacillus oceanisediminis]
MLGKLFKDVFIKESTIKEIKVNVRLPLETLPFGEMEKDIFITSAENKNETIGELRFVNYIRAGNDDYIEHGYIYSEKSWDDHDKELGFYKGEIRNFLPHGKGILKGDAKLLWWNHYFRQQSLRYEGTFNNGKYHGQGKFLVDDELVYEGDFYEGRIQGEGTFYNINGDYYQGFWMNNKMEGEGTFYNKNKNVIYEGFWKNGQANGDGILYINEDSHVETLQRVYKGQFQNGYIQTDREEVLFKVSLSDLSSIWTNTTRLYEGEIQNNVRIGFGREFDEHGRIVYEGKFKDNLRHGRGKWYIDHHSERFYEGEFRGNLRDGFGIEFYDGKIEYEGSWKSDKYNGFGILHKRFSKYELYEGEWINGKRDGYGKQLINNKITYSGQWVDNNPSGEGLYYYYPYKSYLPEDVPFAIFKNDKQGTSFPYKVIATITNYNFEKKYGFFKPMEGQYHSNKIFFHVNDIKIKMPTNSYNGYSTSKLYLVEVVHTEKGLKAIRAIEFDSHQQKSFMS